VHSELTLISTVAIGFGLALVLGFLAVRLKLPAIVGYLVAGVLMGPATPGFVADISISNQLAEIGVMLLMFGVGLHFSIDDLLAVRKIAVPGAVLRIVLVTGIGVAVGFAWGWSAGAGVVFGLAISVASTAVFLKSLESRGALETLPGKIGLGWLIVEDLVMVLALVLLPALGAGPEGGATSARSIAWTLISTLLSVGLFVAIMLVGGRKLFPWILWQVAKTGSRELFTLCVVAAAVGVAFASAELFGVSFALGAFFAGTLLAESALAHRAAAESLPLRDAFGVLFFVSVGMLFDPTVVVREPARIVAVVAIIVVARALIVFATVIAFRYPMSHALTLAAGLAQIGEFSFILAGVGVALGVLPNEGQDLILAGALVSIAVNYLLFAALDPIQKLIRRRPGLAVALDRPLDPLAALPLEVGESELTAHVVLVGYGRVGKRIGDALAANRIRFVVAEQNREIVEELRERGVHAVTGDASDPVVLAQTHVMRARMLVVATPDPFLVRKMIETARILNPAIEAVVRTHSDEEAALLRRDRVGKIFFGEEELASGMIRHILAPHGANEAVQG
jgi:CPA2 family monovalent cation:H+ antiporter-2